MELFVLNSKDDRHEILAPISRSDDTSTSSRDEYFGMGARGFFPVLDDLDVYLSLANVAGLNKDLEATQTQLMSSLSLQYRYKIFNISSLSVYEFRINRDKFSHSDLDIPNLLQYNQSVTSIHDIYRNISLLWGIHQGASDNLNTGNEERITYSGYQFDLGIRQKFNSNLFVNYFTDYEYRSKSIDGNKSGGFQIDGALTLIYLDMPYR